MSLIPSTIFVLDSRLKSSGTNQLATYNMVPAGTLQSGTYQVLSYHSTNQVFNCETGVNSLISWDEFASAALTVNIPAGYYSAATLATALDLAMTTESAASGDTNTYTTVYNATNGLYTTTSDNATYRYNWLAGVTPARKLMGYDALDGVLALTQTSDVPINLTLHSNLFLLIDVDGSRNVTSLTDPSVEYSLIFPLNQDYQEEIDSLKQGTFSQTITVASSINSIVVTQFTDDGVALVNAPDYELIIQKLF